MLRYNPLFSILLLILMSIKINAQTESDKQDVFCDYNLDYLPRFKSIKKLEDLHGGGMFDDEFTVALKQIFNSCNFTVEDVSLFSGLIMQSSGLYPEPLKNSIWAIIQLDEKGDVEFLRFENIKLDDQVINCIRQTIDGSRVFPAVRQNVPVKCMLYLIIK